jgi:hypothetical protein
MHCWRKEEMRRGGGREGKKSIHICKEYDRERYTKILLELFIISSTLIDVALEKR